MLSIASVLVLCKNSEITDKATNSVLFTDIPTKGTANNDGCHRPALWPVVLNFGCTLDPRAQYPCLGFPHRF